MGLFGFFSAGIFFGVLANIYAINYGADNYFVMTLFISLFFLLIGVIHSIFYSIVERNKIVAPVIIGISALFMFINYLVWF